MTTEKIFSGVSSATFSMSMPPAAEAMKAIRLTARSTSIDRYSLAVNGGTGFHVDDIHRQSVGTGLRRHEPPPQHPGGTLPDLVEALRNLDAAGFAAAPRMHLGLDHPQIAAERPCRRDGCFRRLRGDARRYRDTVVGKQSFRLVFVEIHARICCAFTAKIRAKGAFRAGVFWGKDCTLAKQLSNSYALDHTSVSVHPLQ